MSDERQEREDDLNDKRLVADAIVSDLPPIF